MITNIYVIDLAVKDLVAATETFKKLFGVDPIPMKKEMDPWNKGEQDAVHFPLPGPGKEGLHSMGLFALNTDNPKTATSIQVKKYLENRGEGVILIGCEVDNLEETQRDWEEKGVKFLSKEPRRYHVGRNNVTEPIHGLQFSLAEHDKNFYEKWHEQK